MIVKEYEKLSMKEKKAWIDKLLMELNREDTQKYDDFLDALLTVAEGKPLSDDNSNKAARVLQFLYLQSLHDNSTII